MKLDIVVIPNTQPRLDPRTKLLLLLLVNILMVGGGLSGASAAVRPLFAALPLVLLLWERKWTTASAYAVFVAAALCSELYWLSLTTGALNLIVVIFSGVISRFVPGLTMGMYVVSSTKISELIAALERMHLPQAIIIPFAVMMRFFPTIKEENAAIADAMRMRGVRTGGSNMVAMLEYRVVPLMVSIVKIGEELSAAALTRGLGGTNKRTNICEIGFRALDLVLIAVTLGAFLYGMLGGIR